VCHGREGLEDDLFYVYAYMFMKLHVQLPFDEFTMGVLRKSTWRLPNFIRIVGGAFRLSGLFARRCI